MSPDTVLDENTINKMKVFNIQVALQARWIFKNVLKAIMTNQLKTAVTKGVAILQDCQVTEI